MHLAFDLVEVEPADTEALDTRLLTRDQLHGAALHAERLGEYRARGVVRTIVDGWRRDSNLEGIAVASDDGAAPRARLHVHMEHDGIVDDIVEIGHTCHYASRDPEGRPVLYGAMPFRPVTSDFDLVALERRLLERWQDEDVFARSLRRREGGPEWVFYEGPPTANGRPGTHHVWARVFKDLYPRFHTMRGKYVARKGGWDCHGLPVELEVETELGFSGKAQIEQYGIEAFNAKCRESVHRYVDDFARLTERIGMWIDTDDAYWTLSTEYIESVWWLFKQMWDKGLIYEGFKVVPYCGRCGTALSSHEVALGYRRRHRDRRSTSASRSSVATSTSSSGPPPRGRCSPTSPRPWGPRSSTCGFATPAAAATWCSPLSRAGRARRRRRDRRARSPRRSSSDSTTSVRSTISSSTPTASRVVAADFVTLDDGSGIVHLAPAFGEIDREVGEAEGLPVLNPVDATARFDESVPPYARASS